MKLRGVAAALSFFGLCFADQAKPTPTTQELLEELFKGVVQSQQVSKLEYRFIDLEAFLDEYALGDQFRALSDQEKELLIENIDLFNSVIIDAFSELLLEETFENSDIDETD